MKPFRIPFFALALGIALVFAFLLAGPVFAQDELPPAPAEPAAAVEEAAPAEEAPAEPAPAPETAPVEEPALVEEPAPAEEPAEVVVEEAVPPVEEPPAEAAPDIVPLSETGEVLPMASQEAAEVMAEPDPWFACTIDDLDLTPGDGKCSFFGANALNNALAAYATKGGSGAIFIEPGIHTVSGTVLIHGPSLINLTGIIANGTSTSADVHLNLGAYNMQITGTTKGFTLKGLDIYGDTAQPLVYFFNNTGALTLSDLIIDNGGGADRDGLVITNNTGNVILNMVKADNNGGEGARITGVTGSVSLTNSSFNDNGAVAGTQESSLNVESTGVITLNGVSANNFHRGNGASLKSNSGITVKNSVFNTNRDNDDGDGYIFGHGLYIDANSKGNIVMDRVYANYNHENGINAMTQIGGAITMNNIEAVGNYDIGVVIDNCFASGLCTTTTGAVTLSNLTITDNPYGNLYVAANGAITATTVQVSGANNAGSFGGIRLSNELAKTVSAVTLKDASSQGNYYAGIRIFSKGAVSLDYVRSTSNTGATWGLYVDTAGGVTWTSTLGNNNTSSNTNGVGTRITAKGSVTINNLTSNSNGNNNLQIDNTGGTGVVTVTGANVDGDLKTEFNFSIGGSGAVVASKGAITFTNVEAQGNFASGLVLQNNTAASAQPVTVKTTSTTNRDIVLSNNKNAQALIIQSKGNVSVSGVMVSNSSVYPSPIYIDNRAGTGTVTLSNTTVSKVEDAGTPAVYIMSKGSVTISNLTTNNNRVGLYINNTEASGTPGVTISDLSTQNNKGYGFMVYSKGPVKITNVTASGTTISGTGIGGYVDTQSGGAAGTVTLLTTGTNWNYFNNNAQTGLEIWAGGVVVVKDANIYDNSSNGLFIISSGAVTVTNPSISGNKNGLYIDNHSVTAAVTVGGPSRSGGYTGIMGNENANLSIWTQGALTLSYLNISGSPIALTQSGIAGDVMLNEINFSTDSFTTLANVIQISSKGTVTASNVTTSSGVADGILGSGMYIDNRPANGKPVTVTNFTDTSGKGEHALHVLSAGAITVNNFNVYGGSSKNRDYGIRLDNIASTTKAGVTVKRPPTVPSWIVASDFSAFALDIVSHGPVVVDNLALGSSGKGLSINTDLGSVTVTNTYANSNTNGINIIAGGAIILTNIDAYENSERQVVLNNYNAPVASPVTVTGLDSWGWTSGAVKGTGGLEIDTKGAVTLTNINVGNQKVSGYALDISTTGAVTINATGTTRNNLSGNQQYGGRIYAGGNVSISKLDANDTVTNYGLYISTSAGSITITDANFNNNADYGLWAIITGGAGGITLTNVDATGNKTRWGATLDNYSGTGGVTVNGISASDRNLINNNKQINLSLNTNGAVTINYLNASNSTQGINLPFTIGDITMNYVEISDLTEDNYGLQFYSKGTVNLSHIKLWDTPYGGLLVDNATYANAAKNVTLLDIDVYDNDSTDGHEGIYVFSKGAITAKDIKVSQSDHGTKWNYGLYLQNDGSPVKAGVIVGTVSYTKNSLSDFENSGVEIWSSGPVTIDKTEVQYANGDGIFVNNKAGGAGTGGVTITNNPINTTANQNDGMGINIQTNGNVVLTGVTSTDNGTDLNEHGISIDVGATTGSLASGTVTLTGIKSQNNYGDELRVVALKQVTIKNIEVADYSSPSDGMGAYIQTNGGVSILDPGGSTWNVFDSNVDSNLVINAKGAVSLVKIEAKWSESASGVTVNTDGAVTITTLNANNNPFYGLEVTTKGAITASGLDIQSNGGGATLANNQLGSTGGVTVKTSKFINNTETTPVAGLVIETNGAALLDQVTSSNNGGYGARVSVGGATATVTVTKSIFEYNGDDGLNVDSFGNITLNGVTVKQNSASGAYGANLNNEDGSGTVSILATLGANDFSGNNLDGLKINSKGAVVINKTTANSNQGDGIDVYTLGAITTNGITANLNGSGSTGKGMFLDNHLGTGTVSVLTTMGKNYFGNNHAIGLDINTSKAVVINSVTASSNFNGAGINVDNHWAALGTGTVTVTGAVLQGNSQEGIKVNSNGSVTLTGIEAISNGSGGTYSGINISTNGFNALVQNSISMLNYKNGIEANVGVATPPLKLTVKGCIFWNNNRSGGSNPNLLINPGGLLEIIS